MATLAKISGFDAPFWRSQQWIGGFISVPERCFSPKDGQYLGLLKAADSIQGIYNLLLFCSELSRVAYGLPLTAAALIRHNAGWPDPVGGGLQQLP